MRANANKRRQTQANASAKTQANAGANVDKLKQTLTPPFIAVFTPPVAFPLIRVLVYVGGLQNVPNVCLFGTFPTIWEFSRVFRGCPFVLSFLSRPIKSTYKERSRQGPRHNEDFPPKKVRNTLVGNTQFTVVSIIITPEILFFSDLIWRGVIYYARKFLPQIIFVQLIMRDNSVSHYVDQPVFWG